MAQKCRTLTICVPRVELELAFILGAPLKGPGVTMLDVLRATEFVVPSIEIIDTRVDEPRQIYDTIADNGAGAGIVLGGRPFHPRDLDLRMVPGILYRNADIEETGLSCGVMGHPANGVAWLANKLSTLGLRARAGANAAGRLLCPPRMGKHWRHHPRRFW